MVDISILFLWFINQRSHHWGGTRSLGLGRGIRISQIRRWPPSIPGAVPDPEAGGGNIVRSRKSEGEMEDVPMVNLWLTDG